MLTGTRSPRGCGAHRGAVGRVESRRCWGGSGDRRGGCWGALGRGEAGAGAADPLAAQRLPHKIRKLHSVLERMLVSSAPSCLLSPVLAGFVPASQSVQGHRGALEVLPHLSPPREGCPLPAHAEVPLCPQDPSWNHRVYRLAVAKLSPPIIPFVPLLLKGGYLGGGAAGSLLGVLEGVGWAGVTPALPSDLEAKSDP